MKPSPANLSRRNLLRQSLALGAASLLPPAYVHAGGRGLSSTDYQALDATAMAAGVRQRQFSASELLEAALKACEHSNPALNAVVLRHDDRARKLAATQRKGALAGVPLLVKDLNAYLDGTITTHGCRFYRDNVASVTSTLLARYEAAGMVGFAKSASPEFGMTPTTESALWGVTRNPWNPALSAGGSSGGAAVAVAAGMVPVAHATDGGGSIRIPAAHCGLFGLKPSRYRTPQGPGRFEGWFGASVAHAITRSVRDSALMLDVGQGHESGSPYWARPLVRPYMDEISREPGRLRVALIGESLTGTLLDTDTAHALTLAAALMARLGHHIEPARFPVSALQVFGPQGVVTRTALLSTIRNREQQLGRSVTPDDVEPITWAALQMAQKLTAEDLFRARSGFELVSLQMEQFFERYDVILSPVTATTAPPLGELALNRPFDDYAKAATGSAAFTVIANIGGQPSMSVPLYWTKQGQPVGSLFTARLGAEDTLLRLAAQLEAAQPWAARRPPLKKA
ncbi:amidase [Craterilacuibacter sp.]|uniref:amidase n=1 Tax=Craterilacuibacter sp. TaxID=2870909 RepID=UPI003F3349BE